MTVRTHLSKNPLLSHIRAEKQKQWNTDRKPNGFWYSVDGDWERWCKEESYLSLHNVYRYEVILGDENILLLSSVADIDEFHKKYSIYRGRYEPRLIDWFEVAAKYDGIEIAPYQWERRLDGSAHDWYYTWDCASGCIWQPKGATVKLISAAHHILEQENKPIVSQNSQKEE